MKTILLAAALAIGLPTLCFAGQPLSNDQAIRTIEDYWSAAFFHLPLGRFDVAQDGADGGPRSISRAQLQRWYLPLEQAGVIAIAEDPIAASISVTVAAEGQKRNVSKNPEMLALSYGPQKIDKIISNEPVSKGGEDYRILRVRYNVAWDEAVASVLTVCEKPVTPQQRAVVLLKYDARAGDWKVAAEDDANADDYFCTQDVGRVLDSEP